MRILTLLLLLAGLFLIYYGGVMLLSLSKCTALKEGYGESGGFSKSTKTTDGYEIGVTHQFDYALVPHAGDWRESLAYRRGMEFNHPLIASKVSKHSGSLSSKQSLVTISAENVVVSAIKTGREGTVLRVYEAEGKAMKASEAGR